MEKAGRLQRVDSGQSAKANPKQVKGAGFADFATAVATARWTGMSGLAVRSA